MKYILKRSQRVYRNTIVTTRCMEKYNNVHTGIKRTLQMNHILWSPSVMEWMITIEMRDYSETCSSH